jgi:hypothetical protein
VTASTGWGLGPGTPTWFWHSETLLVDQGLLGSVVFGLRKWVVHGVKLFVVDELIVW